MLLPYDIHPKLSIYYNGAVILGELNKVPQQEILELFLNVKKVNNISFSLFIYSLDWLYLIEEAEVNEEGVVQRCI